MEIVVLKEGGSGLGDGDLLLGGLHLSCDMYSGLKAWIEKHFLASTLTLSPIACSHYCCTPMKGQCSKAPSIKAFLRFIDRSRCDSNSTSVWSYFSSSAPSLNLSHSRSCSLPLVHAVSLPHLAISPVSHPRYTHFFFLSKAKDYCSPSERSVWKCTMLVPRRAHPRCRVWEEGPAFDAWLTKSSAR